MEFMGEIKFIMTNFGAMKLLIIDDNKAVRTTLRMVLASDYDRIVTTGDPTLLPAILAEGDVDAVLLDMNFDNRRLDGSDGLFWLARIKESSAPPAVVLITAFGDVPLAVEAMKRGAEDFVTKPWDNDDLKARLRRAIERNREAMAERRALVDATDMLSRGEDQSQMTLDEVKAAHIRAVVDKCGGNLSLAAERLGINRQTLYNQLRKL